MLSFQLSDLNDDIAAPTVGILELLGSVLRLTSRPPGIARASLGSIRSLALPRASRPHAMYRRVPSSTPPPSARRFPFALICVLRTHVSVEQILGGISCTRLDALNARDCLLGARIGSMASRPVM